MVAFSVVGQADDGPQDLDHAPVFSTDLTRQLQMGSSTHMNKETFNPDLNQRAGDEDIGNLRSVHCLGDISIQNIKASMRKRSLLD